MNCIFGNPSKLIDRHFLKMHQAKGLWYDFHWTLFFLSMNTVQSPSNFFSVNGHLYKLSDWCQAWDAFHHQTWHQSLRLVVIDGKDSLIVIVPVSSDRKTMLTEDCILCVRKTIHDLLFIWSIKTCTRSSGLCIFSIL